jgi:hypothetical protein
VTAPEMHRLLGLVRTIPAVFGVAVRPVATDVHQNEQATQWTGGLPRNNEITDGADR